MPVEAFLLGLLFDDFAVSYVTPLINKGKIMLKPINTFQPGTSMPRSEIYEQVGPRGGLTSEQTDSTRAHPLPPTEKPGQR
jgi:hypothetical protein